MTKLNTETKTTESRELTIDQLDSASGGMSYLGIASMIARLILPGVAPVFVRK